MSAFSATLSEPVVRRSPIVWSIALIVGGAALVALAAQVSISLPFTPVPITGQTFGVVLVGSALGLSAGAASLTLYVAAGLVGAPVYAGGDHGWSILSSATGGYLIGFIAAAALTGFLARHRWDRVFPSATAAMLSGNALIYVIGLPWLAVVLNTDTATTLEYGLYPFVVGDLLKIYLAAVLLPAAWRFSRGGPSRQSSDRDSPQ